MKSSVDERAFHRWLRPGGSAWVFDPVASPLPAVQAVMWRHYGEYLTGLKGEQYRDEVFAYVEREDTRGRSVTSRNS